MAKQLVSHRDMELLRMAMLRHEETFRHQVHELHRLYRVQKQLMGRPSSSSELSCRRQIRRRRQPRRALDLLLHRHLPAADECVAVAPPPAAEDGLELTLAIGSGGGRCRRRRRDETRSSGAATATATPLGSESDDVSGGSQATAASSSTDTGGSPPYKRAMPAFRRLQEAAAAAVKKQTPRSPWLVQCVGLEMA